MYGDNSKTGDIELQENPASVADSGAPAPVVAAPEDDIGAASGSTKRHNLDGLKKRFGSLRKKKNTLE